LATTIRPGPGRVLPRRTWAQYAAAGQVGEAGLANSRMRIEYASSRSLQRVVGGGCFFWFFFFFFWGGGGFWGVGLGGFFYFFSFLGGCGDSTTLGANHVTSANRATQYRDEFVGAEFGQQRLSGTGPKPGAREVYLRGSRSKPSRREREHRSLQSTDNWVSTDDDADGTDGRFVYRGHCIGRDRASGGASADANGMRLRRPMTWAGLSRIRKAHPEPIPRLDRLDRAAGGATAIVQWLDLSKVLLVRDTRNGADGGRP